MAESLPMLARAQRERMQPVTIVAAVLHEDLRERRVDAPAFILSAGRCSLRPGGDIETIANLGLTLLLFVIGLEVNPRALMSSGKTLSPGGVAA